MCDDGPSHTVKEDLRRVLLPGRKEAGELPSDIDERGQVAMYSVGKLPSGASFPPQHIEGKFGNAMTLRRIKVDHGCLLDATY
jgi:hypothetical protein